MNVDTAIVKFPCPTCLNYFEQSFGQVKKDRALSCPCGQIITIDDIELKAATKEIKKNLKMQEMLSRSSHKKSA